MTEKEPTFKPEEAEEELEKSTIEAEKLAEQCHEDVCAIYCRTFAKGIVSVLEDFFPEIVINFYNVSSRRDGKDSDCKEAFQVLSPKRIKNPR